MQENPQIPTTPPLSGADLVDDANDALKTIGTDFSGDIDPAALAWPYSKWADTANGLLKRRNAANSDWDVIGALSLNAGADHAGDEPAHPFPYMRWADTANGLLKRRSADNTAWTTLGPLFDLFFARGNILGTVSQSSGVPIGALIESGSNANGNYTRFADGTQVCWRKINTGNWGITTAYGNVYISSSTGSYTFPVAFSDVPAVSGATWAVDGGLPITSLTSATATGMSLRFTSGVSATLSLGILWLAIGRWF